MTFSSARPPVTVEYKQDHIRTYTVTNLLMWPLLGDHPEHADDLPSPWNTVHLQHESVTDICGHVPTPLS